MQPQCNLPALHIRLDDRASVDELRHAIYESLGLIRVYTKKPGKPADYIAPFAIPVGGTVEDLALKVHRDVAAGLMFAKVWGKSTHDGQTVSREHVLEDRDMVELHV